MSFPANPDTIARPLVFSGFPLWFFRRSQQIPVVDFVLQQLWGYTRQPVSREPVMPARVVRTTGAGRTATTAVARPTEPVRPMRRGMVSADR
jgi:hypothetical protein